MIQNNYIKYNYQCQMFKYKKNGMKMKKVFIIFCTVVLILTIFNTDKSISTIKFMRAPNISDLVDTLINDVYGGVEFEKVNGVGRNFEERYYCSNLCIDVCKGGVVKYLCDITATSNEDLFSKWLFEEENVRVIKQEEENGAIFQELDGNSITATVYINPENKRIFAAIISIKI